ncbi:hypothetical protein [Pseudomonas sp. TCU-HL1]|uniref:hypothetical protein n=1 Tax=Pseudomonas sp. TCU-HL1 TaxID=1856685 RepID=UPI000856AE52|nr:hypothetical protein [Pseudomonas sp. TCU-HL1]AOE86116.1 triosephosphate isomerase [Pseudomonas sp. TCU-HL1]
MAMLVLSGCSTYTGQTGQMIVDSAKDGDALGVGLTSIALPFAFVMDVFTLGNTLDDEDMENVATAEEKSADIYSAGDEVAVATNQANVANTEITHEPVPTNSQTGQAAVPFYYDGKQDELIASLKDHALPECVECHDNRFFNICNFDIEVTFCINNPTPFDKAPLTNAGAAYDCAKDQYGLWTIEAGKTMTGTLSGERAAYSACRHPYSPVKIKGIVGGVDHYACK